MGTVAVMNTLHFRLHVSLGKTESQSTGMETQALLDSCGTQWKAQKSSGESLEDMSDLGCMFVAMLFPLTYLEKKK